MNLQQKVRYAIKLDRKKSQIETELDAIKAELIKAAEAKDVPKTPTECGGWSAVFKAADGQIARITAPANKLKTSIDSDSDEWKAIIDLLGPARFIYFPTKTEIVRREVSKNIRDELLAQGKVKQRKVLLLITSKSKPTVSFETKDTSVSATKEAA